MSILEITKPDDWHIHLRDGGHLARTVKDVSSQFARAIVMPNLKPPVINTTLAKDYFDRIKSKLPDGVNFKPLMTLYLTDRTTAQDILDAKNSGVVQACKLYPAGATTHSDAGVTDIQALYPVFEAMAEQQIVLCVHGEVTDPDVDIFDRETAFIENDLAQVVRDFPTLSIVLEHISTKHAVNFVLNTPKNVGATITPHHLLLNRNDLLAGGIKPHHYCLPILKTKEDQTALIKAAISGLPKFFLGTDSAPHAKDKKESPCGCAGIYSAYSAIELYAEAFMRANALKQLEAFASHYGADFYGLPRNTDKIKLVNEAWTVPAELTYADETIIPFFAGETLHWKLKK